jgi:asparagine synthase (glutamine-hydrolysing)
MCGIAGKLWADRSRAVSADLVRRMAGTLRHRGPDDEGVWVDGPVGLGARRLAILDLSPRGRQPMANEDGSLRLVFNGEIYNFQELRAGLAAKGHAFRSESDTETILHLYEEEGVDCVRRLRGMFAFALWDGRRERLFAARDRLGVKPFFYLDDGERFLFASGPRAILEDPEVRAEPDHAALHHYLTFGYVPGPWSAFRGIRKLPPAHYLLVRRGEVTLRRYWSLRYAPKRQGSEDALGEELTALLEEAVRLRLRADVPLGVLLSGGIDSSAVVALMRAATGGRIRTFSIGFDPPEYDERAYARQVAERFETDHQDLVVEPEATRLLPRLVWHHGEPFADSSALPSYALCEMARRSVTVALSGDGGDEAFFGYERHLASALAARLDWMPRPARAALAWGSRLLPAGRPRSLGYRARRLAEPLAAGPRRRYGCWITCFGEEQKRRLYSADFSAAVGEADSMSILDASFEDSGAADFLESTVATDVRLYLPDDLLVKMDIASMAHSLEVRSPFLDHQVMEFAASLPPALKLRGLTPKYLLRRAMRTVLPSAIVRRRKMGFGVPIDAWFRGELGDVAGDVLLGRRARERGRFRIEEVRRLLDEHASGRGHHHALLWSLLMLELWERMFLDGPAPAEPPGPGAGLGG